MLNLKQINMMRFWLNFYWIMKKKKVFDRYLSHINFEDLGPINNPIETLISRVENIEHKTLYTHKEQIGEFL